MRKFINLDTQTLMALLLDRTDKKIGKKYPKKINREVRFRLEDLENLVKYLNNNLFNYVNCNLDLYDVIDCVVHFDNMYLIEWDTLADEDFYEKYDYASENFCIVSKDGRTVINTFLRKFHEKEREEILKVVQDFVDEYMDVQDLEYERTV